MLRTSRPARGILRCERLEGRVLLATFLDLARFSTAVRGMAEVSTAFVGTLPRSLGTESGSVPPLSLDNLGCLEGEAGGWNDSSLSALSALPRMLELDLDGDNRLDRVELLRPPGSSVDRLEIFRGLGEGGFELIRGLTLSHVAVALLADDFDQDGRLDVFAVGEASGQGTLLLNLGNNHFHLIPQLVPPVLLGVADLDGDGLDDFIYANQFTQRFSVSLSDPGRTTFTEGPSDLLAPEKLHLADLNGDGLLDLIVCTGASGIRVYPGLGQGKFGPAISGLLQLACDEGSSHVAVVFLQDQATVADRFHQSYDAFPDLVVANEATGMLSVFVGEGGWQLRPTAVLQTGLAPSSIQSADLNGDGIPDLVVTMRGENSVWIIPGLGGGRFDLDARRVLPVGPLPMMSFIADFTGNQRLDLAVLNAGSNELTLYLDVASPTTRPLSIPTGGQGPSTALLRDLNGDGRADLVIAHRWDNGLSLLIGNNQGLSLHQTISYPTGQSLALANTGELWTIYVLGDTDSAVHRVSFLAPIDALSPEAPSEPPLLDPTTVPTNPSVESPSSSMPAVVSMLSQMLVGMAYRADPPLEEEVDESPSEAEPPLLDDEGTVNLSGAGEELDESEEVEAEAETDLAVPTEPALQKFLLGTQDTPPPTVVDNPATSETTELPIDFSEEVGSAPLTLEVGTKLGSEAEMLTSAEPPEPEWPEKASEESAFMEMMFLLLVLGLLGDRPALGRQGDGAS